MCVYVSKNWYGLVEYPNQGIYQIKLSQALTQNDKLDDAINQVEEAKEGKTINDDEYYNELNNITTAFQSNEKYEEAIKIYQDAISYFDKTKDMSKVAELQKSLGFIKKLWEYKKSEWANSYNNSNVNLFKTFRNFIVILIQPGYKVLENLDIFEYVIKKQPDEDEWEKYLEYSLACQFPTSITVNLSNDLYKTIINDDLKNEMGRENEIKNANDIEMKLREKIFYESGVDIIAVNFQQDNSINNQEFRVNLNQLRGPLRETKNSNELFIFDLTEEIKQNVSVYLTTTQMDYAFQKLDQAFPMLVFNSLERFNSVFITKVLRGLLEEHISIRDLRSILEALLLTDGIINIDLENQEVIIPDFTQPVIISEDRGIDEVNSLDYTNHLRLALKKYISHKYSFDKKLKVIRVSEELENQRTRS